MIYDTFTMDCPNCGPGTISFVKGKRRPHGCSYVVPSMVIHCDGHA